MSGRGQPFFDSATMDIHHVPAIQDQVLGQPLFMIVLVATTLGALK